MIGIAQVVVDRADNRVCSCNSFH